MVESPDLLAGIEPRDERFQTIDGSLIWTTDGIAIFCAKRDSLWSYWVAKGGAPITIEITSRRAPWEEDSHSRDPKLKKWLRKHPDVDVDAVMGSFEDLGMFLMGNPDLVEAYVGVATPTPEEPEERISEADRTAAMELLRNPDLLECIDTIVHRKLIGETKNAFLTFFVFLSALTDHPLNHRWNGDSSTGKTAIVTAVVDLFPKEMILLRAGMTAKVFYYDYSTENEHGDRVNDLTGKVVVILEEEESQDFLREIKPILSHDMDEITYSFVDKVDNRNKTCAAIIRGHPAYMGLTTQVQLDEQLSTRSSTGTPDYSREKFESILDSTAREATLPKRDTSKDDTNTIRHAIRLLRDVVVVVPYMPIVRRYFPYTAPRAVRDFKQFIGVVKTVAFLHQYQRTHIDIDGCECVVANLSDLDIATRINEAAICETVSGVPRDVLNFYRACVAKHGDPYTRITLMGVYREHFGKEIGRTRLKDRYIDPLVERGLFEVDKSEKEHKFSIIAKNLSLSVDLEKMIANVQSVESEAQMRADFMYRSQTDRGGCVCV